MLVMTQFMATTNPPEQEVRDALGECLKLLSYYFNLNYSLYKTYHDTLQCELESVHSRNLQAN